MGICKYMVFLLLVTSVLCTMLIAHCAKPASIMMNDIFQRRVFTCSDNFAITMCRTGVCNLAPSVSHNQNCSTGTGNGQQPLHHSEGEKYLQT